MKTICFIENRGKTVFWAALAAEFRDRGHRICWIVQNHAFTPKEPRAAGDDITAIPYPSRRDMNAPDPALRAALESDRGRQFFGNGSGHYSYYSNQISAALADFAPDVVIGESTLFHELLAIEYCKQHAILHLQPAGTRYPADRFAVLTYDTQVVAGGSGEKWPDADIGQLASSIVTGATIPTYMRKRNRADELRKVGASVRVWATRLGGERYNTPALVQKWRLRRALKARLLIWDKIARTVPEGRQAILYPLQMQPEANLDVWGGRWADQVEVVKSILRAAPEDIMVAIKANPKAKYEVSDALLALAQYDDRIVLLPQAMKMDAAQLASLGTLTITGTVAYEAVLGKSRCIALGHPLIEAHFPMFHANSIPEAVSRILNEPEAGVGGEATGRQLLEHLVATSYPGIINEPLFDRRSTTPHNIRLVADALSHVMTTQLEQGDI